MVHETPLRCGRITLVMERLGFAESKIMPGVYFNNVNRNRGSNTR